MNQRLKMAKYPFETIEPKWQKYWDENKTFKVTEDANYPKEKRRYVLDMFPYPSGAGLHVGHPEGYTATDIYCRYLRMNGYNVLHPMGYDSFGLPAENYAIKTGTHPSITTNATSITIQNASIYCSMKTPPLSLLNFILSLIIINFNIYIRNLQSVHKSENVFKSRFF